MDKIKRNNNINENLKEEINILVNLYFMEKSIKSNLS